MADVSSGRISIGNRIVDTALELNLGFLASLLRVRNFYLLYYGIILYDLSRDLGIAMKCRVMVLIVEPESEMLLSLAR